MGKILTWYFINFRWYISIRYCVTSGRDNFSFWLIGGYPVAWLKIRIMQL